MSIEMEGGKLKTLLELERQAGTRRLKIIEEIIYKNGDCYYQAVTDDKLISEKLTALGFCHVPRINCFDITIKKVDAEEFRKKVLGIGLNVLTKREK